MRKWTFGKNAAKVFSEKQFLLHENRHPSDAKKPATNVTGQKSFLTENFLEMIPYADGRYESVAQTVLPKAVTYVAKTRTDVSRKLKREPEGVLKAYLSDDTVHCGGIFHPAVRYRSE